MSRVKITALVHTFNAEIYLDKVLDALSDFDELLVCDMHSDDRTLEICAAHNARVIQHERAGFAEPARAFAISQAANEWVFVVDADEIAPDALKEYLYQWVEKGGFAALQIPVMEYFMGHSLRSSYPNLVTRFVQRDKTSWQPTIHGKPIVDGLVDKIPAKRRDLALRHYSNPTVSWRIDKINIYTSHEVARKAHKWKYRSFLMTLLSATIRFIKGYIVKGGFLDGRAGFAYCMLEFFYKFVVLFKIWEQRNRLNL